ncbi:MAG: sterol desaturase family protein, partial [Chromatiales bacterium]
QLLAVLVIGAPPIAVAGHIIVFNVVARLQHGNVYLPERLDRLLRFFVVTSDMHRIHHSARKSETDSNYGGVLPWFDRLLGTYVEEPVGGHLGMTVGLHEFNETRHMTLGWMLINPLLSASADEPLPGSSEEPLPQAPSSARPS